MVTTISIAGPSSERMTNNPAFGGISQRDMIRYSRQEKLRRFIMNALEDNAGARSPIEPNV